jgi:hypothetical protein
MVAHLCLQSTLKRGHQTRPGEFAQAEKPFMHKQYEWDGSRVASIRRSGSPLKGEPVSSQQRVRRSSSLFVSFRNTVFENFREPCKSFKSEARNKFKIPILKFSKPVRPEVSNFEFFSFGFVSDFDIRISDLVGASPR